MTALPKWLLKKVRTALADGMSQRERWALLADFDKFTAPKRGVSHRHQVAKEKVASKRESTRAIREAVFLRATGWLGEKWGPRCERFFGDAGRCPMPAEHLDHFFGRARAESVQTCWALCAGCDREKTLNLPSSQYWLRDFIRHCDDHNFVGEKIRAENRLAFVTTRSALGGGR